MLKTTSYLYSVCLDRNVRRLGRRKRPPAWRTRGGAGGSGARARGDEARAHTGIAATARSVSRGRGQRPSV